MTLFPNLGALLLQPFWLAFFAVLIALTTAWLCLVFAAICRASANGALAALNAAQSLKARKRVV